MIYRMKKGAYIIVCFSSCLTFFAGSVVAQNNSPADTTVYNVVDTKPVFPGDAYAYMRKHTYYPESDINRGIEGTVYVTFVVSKTGKITDVQVEKSASSDLDQSAVRMIKHMPAWIPGKLNGVPVNVRMHLPVKFLLKEIKQHTTLDSLKRKFLSRKGIYITPYTGTGPEAVVTNIQFGLIGGGLGVQGIHLALSGGCGVGYMFNNYIGIVVSAQLQKYYEPYGYSQVISGTYGSFPNSVQDTMFSMDLKYSFTYLQIMPMLEIITSKPGHAGLHIEAGYLSGAPLYESETGIIGNYLQTYPAATSNPYISYKPTNTAIKTTSYSSTPAVYSSDNGVVFNFGIFIPFSNMLSLSVDVASIYKFNTSIGNGSNDVVNFEGKTYNYFQGEYGEANSFLADCKLFIHLGTSKGKASEAK